jgi:predicted GNAT family acetyltransferase
MAEPAVPVAHNLAQHRFEVVVDGKLSRCDYQLDGRVMRLVHTEVPSALEGRGIASRLVAAALAYAREQGVTVAPVCSYVRSYMRRHPETASLLAERMVL